MYAILVDDKFVTGFETNPTRTSEITSVFHSEDQRMCLYFSCVKDRDRTLERLKNSFATKTFEGVDLDD